MIDTTQETQQTAAQRRDRAQEKIAHLEREIGDIDSEMVATEAALVAVQARRQAMVAKIATLRTNLNALPKSLADAEAALILAEGTVDETASRKFVNQIRENIADGKTALTDLLTEQERLDAASDAEQRELSANRSANIERRGELVALIAALHNQRAIAWHDMQHDALSATTATITELRAHAQQAQAKLDQAEAQAVAELTTRWGMGTEAHRLCPTVGNSARIVLDAFITYLESFERATADDQKLPPMITIYDDDAIHVRAQAAFLRLLYIPDFALINAINVGNQGLHHLITQLRDAKTIRDLL